jgi:cyclopropane-fatty-acyl-phospholipid synthase
MSTTAGFGIVIPLVERGLVPFPLIRWGIRKLHKERLVQETQRYRTDAPRTFDVFVDELRQSPVALTTAKANEQHYEVPAQFFEQVLGKHLKYSGCYWPVRVDTLSEAEAAMLSLTCERAEISDGLRILELGCGWGSLAMWMAERYPRSTITAISNSHSQRQFLESQCADRGLDNLCVTTVDMNEFAIDEQFDRVVSVEMFEHMRNYEMLLRRIAGWLKPGGKLFIHVFCHAKYP